MELPRYTVVKTTSRNGGNVCVLAYWSDWLKRGVEQSLCVLPVSAVAGAEELIRANMSKEVFPMVGGQTKAPVC